MNSRQSILSLAVILLGATLAFSQAPAPTTPKSTDNVKGKSDATEKNAEAIPKTPVKILATLHSPRATMVRFFDNTNISDYRNAIPCLDTSKLKSDVSQIDKATLVWQLQGILDRLEMIDLDNISDDPDGEPFFFRPNWHYPAIVIAKCPDGAWRFSSDTVAEIDSFFEAIKDEPLVSGQDWVRDLFPKRLTEHGLILPYYQWLSLLFVVLFGIFVDYFSRWLFNRMALAWFKLIRTDIDILAEQNIWKPVGLLVRALCWYGGTVAIGLRPNVLYILLVTVNFFAVFAGVWTAFLVIDLLSSTLMRRAAKTKTKVDDLLIPLVSRSLKVFVACIGLVVFAEVFDLPLAGLLSGLGIGGLALAFAAKDTLGNLFGSLTVLVDRPFEIGDWIVTQKVEGTVESVGMRSTRVRTFYNSLITVPNSQLITGSVDNMGKRRYRRIKTMLGVQYDTSPEQIEAFCEGIRELIRRHPYTRKDYYHVYFNKFSNSALEILLYCFLETPDWSMELRERHRLFSDILKLAHHLGISFAFPTQTVHLSKEAEQSKPLPKDIDKPFDAGRRAAAIISGRPAKGDDRPGPVVFGDYFKAIGHDTDENSDE